MGVYGYSAAGVKIPEGYLKIKMDKEDGTVLHREILYPADPGSVYHMTKTQANCSLLFITKMTR
jgi:UDP-sulfoquinovose synthase